MDSAFWLVADAWWNLVTFLDRGGVVLYWILLLIFVMWLVISERILFFRYTWPQLEQDLRARWEQRRERQSWEARQIRRALLAEGSMRCNAMLPFIAALVAVCPLFGLLGTVTGMVEVFDVMALVGNGSSRAMASGISRATMPTMAGMVGALSGVFAVSALQKNAQERFRQLEEKMTFDH